MAVAVTVALDWEDFFSPPEILQMVESCYIMGRFAMVPLYSFVSTGWPTICTARAAFSIASRVVK
ncbi:hypothetical protein VP1G_10778 [Cytospora mali]|uniref:Uncharacterized protein n=1 Tax=Cytospora mali TaxID=578113 RepID=A0A194UVY9_CYTMA|nr:hypothetical protein VP1G_10778 [Valsa mali var. pyri (nom. inval.)]